MKKIIFAIFLLNHVNGASPKISLTPKEISEKKQSLDILFTDIKNNLSEIERRILLLVEWWTSLDNKNLIKINYIFFDIRLYGQCLKYINKNDLSDILKNYYNETQKNLEKIKKKIFKECDELFKYLDKIINGDNINTFSLCLWILEDIDYYLESIFLYTSFMPDNEDIEALSNDKNSVEPRMILEKLNSWRYIILREKFLNNEIYNIERNKAVNKEFFDHDMKIYEKYMETYYEYLLKIFINFNDLLDKNIKDLEKIQDNMDKINLLIDYILRYNTVAFSFIGKYFFLFHLLINDNETLKKEIFLTIDQLLIFLKKFYDYRKNSKFSEPLKFMANVIGPLESFKNYMKKVSEMILTIQESLIKDLESLELSDNKDLIRTFVEHYSNMIIIFFRINFSFHSQDIKILEKYFELLEKSDYGEVNRRLHQDKNIFNGLLSFKDYQRFINNHETIYKKYKLLEETNN